MLHFSAKTITRNHKQEKDHLVDIPNNNSIASTDDDDKYSESSEGRSVDIDDKDISDNSNNVTITTKLISHFGQYWNQPEDDRRSDSVYWVVKLENCFDSDKKSLKLNDLDRYVLSSLLDIHIKDGQCADTIAISHTSKVTPQFGFNRDIKEFGQEGWDVTMSELKENLIGVDAVSFTLSMQLKSK